MRINSRMIEMKLNQSRMKEKMKYSLRHKSKSNLIKRYMVNRIKLKVT